MCEKEKEIEKPNERVDIVEKILEFLSIEVWFTDQNCELLEI